MTKAIFDESILSDLYKDAYGVRPREPFWVMWFNLTIEEKNETWNRILADLETSIEEDKAREEEARISFEKSLADLQAAGAKDREQAIEWLVESLRGPDYPWQEPGEVCYALGLSYSMEKEFEPWFERVVKPRLNQGG